MLILIIKFDLFIIKPTFTYVFAQKKNRTKKRSWLKNYVKKYKKDVL